MYHSEISARQTKTAYKNSEIVERLHGLVFENNFFFISFSWVTFNFQVGVLFFLFLFFSMSQGLTKKTTYARMF